MTPPYRYCVYVTQKVKGPLMLKLGKNEAERGSYNGDAPDIPLMNLDSFIRTVSTLSRSMIVRNALSLLIH